jgi:hypothetical protein
LLVDVFGFLATLSNRIAPFVAGREEPNSWGPYSAQLALEHRVDDFPAIHLLVVIRNVDGNWEEQEPFVLQLYPVW